MLALAQMGLLRSSPAAKGKLKTIIRDENGRPSAIVEEPTWIENE